MEEFRKQCSKAFPVQRRSYFHPRIKVQSTRPVNKEAHPHTLSQKLWENRRSRKQGIQYKEEKKEIPKMMENGIPRTTAMCQAQRAKRTSDLNRSENLEYYSMKILSL